MPGERPIPTPTVAMLGINDGCNSRCSYCWIWKQSDYNMPAPLAHATIEGLARIGTGTVTFSGGEPLRHPELQEFIRHASDLGMRTAINTNGLLFTRARVESLAGAGLGAAIVSLDSVRPETYRQLRGVDLTGALRGIDAARGQDAAAGRSDRPLIAVSVTAVVTRQNLDELEEIVDYFTPRHIPTGFQALHPLHGVRETHGYPEGYDPDLAAPLESEELQRLEQTIERLIERRRQGALINNTEAYLRGIPAYLATGMPPPGFSCEAGSSTISIDARGNVHPCWPLPAIAQLDDETSLPSVWSSSDYVDTRQRMQDLDCPGCWLRCHTEYESSGEFVDAFFPEPGQTPRVAPRISALPLTTANVTTPGPGRPRE